MKSGSQRQRIDFSSAIDRSAAVREVVIMLMVADN